ncbi:hypothetical protein PNP85_05650 [Halobacterium salinarum]|uniref:hypothetical protein n=1 Tax=Halobacterium salinarum TaxID=2242 RepID=UPI002555819A|nr:hypothetical protein [Halobacterium salinarum]MDL0138985.1 hypothetical protein [Halobacterium salinarum]
MARRGGYEIGLAKYIIKTPLTVVGFVSMYIFGGSIFAGLAGVEHLFTSQSVTEAVLIYFLTEALPPTTVGEVLAQVVAGTVTAGFLWYWNTAV